MELNPFESGARKCIPAVLIYAREGSRVLMIHKSGRPGDFHHGKWNGIGGKFELDESPVEAAKRELFEEAEIDLDEENLAPLGVLQFPNFKPHKNEDWIVYVFVADLTPVQTTGMSKSCDEGELHWVPEAELMDLNLWPGDREFIPFVIRREPFVGSIWYHEGRAVRSWIQPILPAPGRGT
ncbi:MAG: NUDIX hydrolase [Bdellovibrionota bacterium]